MWKAVHLLLLLLFWESSGMTGQPDPDHDLPSNHLPYLHGQHPPRPGSNVPSPACWGYEPACLAKNRFSRPVCRGDFAGWARSRPEAEQLFFRQADFGYVADLLAGSQRLCPSGQASQLVCGKQLQYCLASNILIDFRALVPRINSESLRYKMDVLGPGEVKLACQLDHQMFNQSIEFLSPLQSWAPELRNLAAVGSIAEEEQCDITVEKTTYIVKLDATVNMYHHFCDFFNLYASLHLNTTSSREHMFGTDVQVLVWENNKYVSNFAPVWKAFTIHPLWNLHDVAGKRVCFRKAFFPLLPRMMFGLFYNTPLITGCENSGLFQAFSEFLLHRLGVTASLPSSHKIRVTLLSRGTKFRRTLNEAELVTRLEDTGRYEVRLAAFSHAVPFVSQLHIVANTDILVGIHGAGLTHSLFLPSWAAVFELYHCEDRGCYSDLARLRGLKYATWEDESKVFMEEGEEGGVGAAAVVGLPPGSLAHKKFCNYRFDADEFLRIMAALEDAVRTDPRYLVAAAEAGRLSSLHAKNEL